MTPRLELVTLRNFYKNATDPLAKHLFVETLSLKAQGYGPEYPEYFLPIDTSDFVAIHHLFCIRMGGKLVPIAGFRQVLLSVSDAYQITAPFLALVEDSKCEEQIKVLRALVETHRAQSRELISSGGFTIRKEYRGAGGISAMIRELVVALMYSDFHEYGSATHIGGGVVRFKTDQLWLQVGYKPIESNGIVLPPVGVATAQGEKVVVMVMNQPSAFAKKCFERHSQTIQKRTEIGAYKPIVRKQAA